MKAIQYQAYGDYGENRLIDLPRPQLRDGEVLLEMRTQRQKPTPFHLTEPRGD